MADIKNSFSKGLTVLNVKTSNFLEANKIKTYISTLKTDVDSLKREVAEIAYAQWCAHTPDQEALFVKFRQIDEKYEMIRQQENELEKLSQKEKEILGDQQSEEQAVERPQPSAKPQIICPECGQTYDYELNFCRKCGTKLRG